MAPGTRSRTRATASAPPPLRIIEIDETTTRQIDSSRQRYKIIHSALDLALCLHETNSGRDALVYIATQLLTEWDKDGQTHIYQGSLLPRHLARDLPGWVDTFLRKLRYGFPTLYLSDTQESEGWTRRLDWGADMQHYDPTQAAEMTLSNILIDNISFAHSKLGSQSTSDMEEYRRFKFQLAIIIAHEIVHLLTGFLTGAKRPDTPEQVVLAGYGTSGHDAAGEAGRAWEVRLLGGLVEFWGKRGMRDDRRKSGTPYFFPNPRSTSATGYQLTTLFVDDFINQSFSLPFHTTGLPQTTKTSLRKAGYEDVSGFRLKRMLTQASVVGSPAPGDPSRSVAYRRPAVESHSTQYYSNDHHHTQSSRSGYISQSSLPSRFDHHSSRVSRSDDRPHLSQYSHSARPSQPGYSSSNIAYPSSSRSVQGYHSRQEYHSGQGYHSGQYHSGASSSSSRDFYYRP